MPVARLHVPTFLLKLAAAAAMVALADLLFFDHSIGASVGLFALIWLVLALLTQPAILRDRRALAAAAAALLFAALQIDHLSLLAWLLFLITLGMAVQLPRTGRFDDAFRWIQRLAWQGFAGLAGPLLDSRRLHKTGRLPELKRGARSLPTLILPVVGGAVFMLLFAAANPIIADVLARLRLPALEENTFVRIVFWAVVLVAAWGVFRPRRRRKLLALPSGGGRRLPGVTPASVALSLVVFNGVFALQNGLDLVYLWSGAGLPEGMTLAEYAHRGAYPLIFTALLAALFVLVVLSPGSETSARPWVRRLVALWIAQNVLLVFSTMLRTLAYVEAYALTSMRIAALAWMALVAVGLGLIGWRLLRGKSAAWLVNANTLAAGLVLTACATFDLNGHAAAWNVRHAQEAGGDGEPLDLCYLHGMGGSSLVPVARLEAATQPGPFRDRLTYVRRDLEQQLMHQQFYWRSWTWRGARQLGTAQVIQRRTSLSSLALPAGERGCDGTLQPQPAPPPPPVASPGDDSLTSQPQP
jgi:hypothetical protein